MRVHMDTGIAGNSEKIGWRVQEWGHANAVAETKLRVSVANANDSKGDTSMGTAEETA
jgi:hypothetical protein